MIVIRDYVNVLNQIKGNLPLDKNEKAAFIVDKTLCETIELLEDHLSNKVTHTKKYLLDRCGMMWSHTYGFPRGMAWNLLFETCILLFEYVCQQKHGLIPSDFGQRVRKNDSVFAGFRINCIEQSLESDFSANLLRQWCTKW